MTNSIIFFWPVVKCVEFYSIFLAYDEFYYILLACSQKCLFYTFLAAPAAALSVTLSVCLSVCPPVLLTKLAIACLTQDLKIKSAAEKHHMPQLAIM